MSNLKWQEPPADLRGGKRKVDWRSTFAALRERPGEWALVVTGGSAATGTQIKRGLIVGAKPGEFETTSRRNPEASEEHGTLRHDIYARYVGGESA